MQRREKRGEKSKQRVKKVKRVTERRVGGSYLLNDWLDFRDISHSQIYQLWARGEGPRRTKIGNRIHISDEADQEFMQRHTEPATV